MSRLVCVSNRITLPRKSAAPGGLAVGVLSALKRTGGLWFGWGGETIGHEPGDPELHIREGVTYATIDLRTRDSLRIATQSQFYFFFVPISASNEVARYLKIKAIRPETELHTLVIALVLDRVLGLLACVAIALATLPFLELGASAAVRVPPLGVVAAVVAIGEATVEIRECAFEDRRARFRLVPRRVAESGQLRRRRGLLGRHGLEGGYGNRARDGAVVRPHVHHTHAPRSLAEVAGILCWAVCQLVVARLPRRAGAAIGLRRFRTRRHGD